ncbi:MAG: hypothetical protein ATN31_09445 [Candidatus Epulonipiscioides saccharophilum]|nr:MAG: hypothetical protein ATN31_09445 [Epulopiscium sp. AS2M-Bin001]
MPAIFKDFSHYQAYNPIQDANKYKALIENHLKENINLLITTQSIKENLDGSIVKIKIHEIPEYTFAFSTTSEDVRIDDKPSKAGNLPSNNNFFETDILLDEAINLLLDQLELPNLYEKKFKELDFATSHKNSRLKKSGIYPRLAKKKTLAQKIKRNKSAKFCNDDIRYQCNHPKKNKFSNAAVFCIMDTSSSMDSLKKELARNFYFILYQFLKLRYINVDLIFIAHSTTASEIDEYGFFHKSQNGGTRISSGYAKTLDIISQRYNLAYWNLYAFHCSDGDNWSNDNPLALKLLKELCSCVNLFGYIEINDTFYFSKLSALFQNEISNDNFLYLKISKKLDVFEAFKKVCLIDYFEH